MRVIDYHQDPRFLAWVGEVSNVDVDPKASASIAHLSVNDDKTADILAVVAYNNITEHDCCMHIASTTPQWASRKFLKACFDYPFKTLGVGRVTFSAPSTNENALRLHKKLGAKHEGTLRGYFGDADLVISSILKEECKWTKESHGIA